MKLIYNIIALICFRWRLYLAKTKLKWLMRRTQQVWLDAAKAGIWKYEISKYE